MKIVHITKGYHHGGASIACKNLVEAQRNIGLNVNVITQEPGLFPNYIVTTTPSYIKSKINFLRLAVEKFIFLFYQNSNINKFHYSLANTGENISKYKILKDADIIHLHWINGGFISLKGLIKIIKLGIPVVWTIHDIWPFTGGCHIAGDCINYTSTCSSCFYLRNAQIDKISVRQQFLKKKIFTSGNLFFIAPSLWQQNRAKSSSLLASKPIRTIHNPISTIEKLPSKLYCRNILSLPNSKKLILFGAFNTNARHKGLDFLIEALQKLKDHKNNELIIFGKKTGNTDVYPLRVTDLGYISNAEKMMNVYRAADIYVTPSIEDNLPNTILESFVCETPVVAFKTGGIPEIIDHKKNGFLAEFKNTDSLAEGIEWCLKNNSEGELSRNASLKIKTHFNSTLIANQVNDYYRDILNQ